MRRLVPATALLMLFSTFASAQEWDFHKDDEGSCLITSQAESAADFPVVYMELLPDGGMRFAIISDTWRSVEDGREYQVTAEITGVEGGNWTLPLDGAVGSDGDMFGLSANFSPTTSESFLKDFAEGNSLRLSLGSAELLNKPLTGSMKSYYRAADCVAKADPFAGGNAIGDKKDPFAASSDDPFAGNSNNTKTDVFTSSQSGVKVRFDPTIWRLQKKTMSDEHDANWILDGGSVYGALIDEEITIGLEFLTDIAYENAKSISDDVQIVSKETIYIRGTKAIKMVMQGNTSGINFTFIGHYLSRPEGSTQLITWTGTQLLDKYEREMNAFLEGLTY